MPKVDLVERFSPAISSVTEVPVDHIASAVQPAFWGSPRCYFDRGPWRSAWSASPTYARARSFVVGGRDFAAGGTDQGADEVGQNGGHWRGLDDLEIATCGWVAWFNEERFHGELDDLTPAEVEAAYYLHESQPNAA